jgi:hypothetical protein
MTDKEKIISLFLTNVKGKRPGSLNSNQDHDGKDGHWLERQMGIKANTNNAPDLFGFEMKNNTHSKTSFGDWSANYYIFKDAKYGLKNRDQFLKLFGKANRAKDNRYSWSGTPVPKIGGFNTFGQILIIDSAQNIHATYSYSKDNRPNKTSLMPHALQQEDLTLARWNKDSIQRKLERKFNQKGWFKCLKNTAGVYHQIVFGDPMSYTTWLNLVKSGDVFFDSGMHQGNDRNYSHWRATNILWNRLVTSRY